MRELGCEPFLGWTKRRDSKQMASHNWGYHGSDSGSRGLMSKLCCPFTFREGAILVGYGEVEETCKVLVLGRV